jgi:hypothetical protein
MTMWIELNRMDDVRERYLETLGRALAVAQHFEVCCKDIVKMFKIGVGLEAGQLQNLDGIRLASERLVVELRHLGTAIRKANGLHVPEPHEMATLIGANKARNYIAHEAGLPPLYFPPGPPPPDLARYLPKRRFPPLDLNLDRLRREVTALAAGDNLVSVWAFEFYEGQRAFGSNSYADEVASWVLSPLEDKAPGDDEAEHTSTSI